MYKRQQLTYAVNPDLLFKNYLYVSGTTRTLQEYFRSFVDIVKEYTDKKTILDIACNDGTQLDYFKEQGYNTFGIDPAENLFKLSSQKHNIICDYLNRDSISKFNTKFDVITAQNVLAHNDHPKDFLLICKEHLNDDGYIFIQTSQALMVERNEFDTIYHEHISFFSMKSMEALAKSVGLNLVDIRLTSIHGTSFVFVLSKDMTKPSYEIEHELTQKDIEKYSKACYKVSYDLYEKIIALGDKGYILVGYGAAAKGNTLLNFSKFKLDFIIDDNPLKHNLFTPGSRIPIVGIDKLQEISEDQKIAFVPLAWNFFDEIKYRVKQARRNDNDIFIKYFPEVTTI